MKKILLRRVLPILALLIAAVLIGSMLLARHYKINIPELLKKDSSGSAKAPDYDVVYKSVDGRDLRLDIYYPTRNLFTKSPVVFYFHGGSWNSGGKDLDDEEIVGTVLEYGLMLVSVEYRLTSESVYPAFLDDCADAIRYITKNAGQYGADTERLGVFGASAGGHISLMMALAKDRYGSDPDLASTPVNIKSCVALCAPTDFINLEVYEDETDRREVEALLRATFGGSAGDLAETYRAASPIQHLRKDAPPIFLAHGEEDRLVPIGQARSFHEAAVKLGMDVRFYPVKNADHKFRAPDGGQTDPPVENILKKMGEFILKELIL